MKNRAYVPFPSRQAARVVLRSNVRLNPEPLLLAYPGCKAEPSLKVHKEDGLVRAFEYRCGCGQTNCFVCE